jgi:type 1 glutamine amidotransferase
MRTLVLCDDYWHLARIPRAGLAALGDCGFEFDWIEDASEWSAERMGTYPLVVLTKSNNVSSANQSQWVTDDVQQAFLEYVRKGNGLVAIHSGTAGYTKTPILRALLGGVFIRHPPQCPVTLHVCDGHPLAVGSVSFTITDEHYHMEMDDPQVDIFLTTESQHDTQPGGWTRTEGHGRVCVLTPGHNLDVWLHPSFTALVTNALRWSSKTLWVQE